MIAGRPRDRKQDQTFMAWGLAVIFYLSKYLFAKTPTGPKFYPYTTITIVLLPLHIATLPVT